MKEILKQIITEFHQEPIPAPYIRRINIPTLPINVRKAFVYIGMRRSGKTWALYQRMHDLMSIGIPKTQLLYINMEDDRLRRLTVSDLQLILTAYWELYPQYTQESSLHFFFDEIAEIQEWESFIRRLLDKESMQLYLSGSSAKMLSKEIATNLRGRTITREIFPFSFQEYAKHAGLSLTQPMTSKNISHTQHTLLRYLNMGGFPETLHADILLHRELLQGYMNTVIYRDIIERHNIKNHLALRQLLLHCLQNPAALLSINKLFQQLKSRGIEVSKNSLYDYLSFFEDAYCLFSIPVYSFSLNKASLKPKKIYPVDTGLITAYSIRPGYQQAALLETAVFLHLRRHYQDIFYFQTASGKEVDFLVLEPNGNYHLYQVTLHMNEASTKEREMSALIEAMGELKLSNASIITLEETGEYAVPIGKIEITPLWRFVAHYA